MEIRRPMGETRLPAKKAKSGMELGDMLRNGALRVSALALACAAGPLLFASASRAADVYDGSTKDTFPAYAPAPSSTWSGPYIGGHLGGGWGAAGGVVSATGGNGGGGGGGGGDNNWTTRTDLDSTINGGNGASGNAGGAGGTAGNATSPGNLSNRARRIGGAGGAGGAGGSVSGQSGDDDGFVGGLHLGYNWQSGSLVLGVEGDASMNGGMDEYLATLRGRIGLARGNTLFYATGGIAFRDGNGSAGALGLATGGGAGGAGGANDDTVDDPSEIPTQLNPRGGFGGTGGAGGTASVTGSGGSSDGGDTGFVVGGGVEMKLSSNVSVGAEGLWYSFDDDAGGDSDVTVVRARLTFHLQRDDDASLKDGIASATVANWAGFYAGANAGAGFRKGQHIDVIDTANGSAGGRGGDGANGNNPGAGNGTPITDGIDDPGAGGGGGGGGAAALVSFADNSAFLGGAHLGYNWQSGSRVFGVEGDANWAQDNFVDYLASVRLRLGYSFDRAMIYGTAGVAFAGGGGSQSVSLSGGSGGSAGQAGFQENNDNPAVGGGNGGAGGAGGTASVSSSGGDDKVGFVVGAGMEYKLTERMSVGLEGLYYAFDGVDGAASASSFTSDDDLSTAVVRARVSIHLNEQHEALK
jgi:opacity protein-like surface antigen